MMGSVHEPPANRSPFGGLRPPRVALPQILIIDSTDIGTMMRAVRRGRGGGIVGEIKGVDCVRGNEPGEYKS